MKTLYESILSSTKSGRNHIKISDELLLSRNYVKKDFGADGVKYYYREYTPGDPYYINKNFDGVWIVRAHCNKKSYTLEVHTLEELEQVEKVWDIPCDWTDKTRRARNRGFQKLVDTLKIKYRF